jgi:DivIVA domain-containing protein
MRRATAAVATPIVARSGVQPFAMCRGAAVFWVMVLVIALIVFGIAAAAVGRGGTLAETYPDRPDTPLPDDRPLRGEDLDALRLSVAFRGYRMDEVDQVLDRVAGELESRDKRIAELDWQLHAALTQLRQPQTPGS